MLLGLELRSRRGRRGRLPDEEPTVSQSAPAPPSCCTSLSAITRRRVRNPLVVVWRLASKDIAKNLLIFYQWGVASDTRLRAVTARRSEDEWLKRWWSEVLRFFHFTSYSIGWQGCEVIDRMSVTSPESGSLPPKAPKSGGSGRRKISLPWFRQASIGDRLSRMHASMRRQHTVDVPLESTNNSTSCRQVEAKASSLRRKPLTGSASMEVCLLTIDWRLPRSYKWRLEVCGTDRIVSKYLWKWKLIIIRDSEGLALSLTPFFPVCQLGQTFATLPWQQPTKVFLCPSRNPTQPGNQQQRCFVFRVSKDHIIHTVAE